MSESYFEMQWPREHLFFDIFVHELLSYRYHWHETEFELNILLQGKAEFCRNGQLYTLEENDIIMIDPGVGHASFSLEAGTLALVLHFSARAFKPYLKPGETYSFHTCTSNQQTRNDPGYCRIRFYAAQILHELNKKGTYSALTAKASMEMILSTLCCMFDPPITSAAPETDTVHQETIRRITSYVEKNYTSKITLEDLAMFSQYNRTYISTFFKNNVGMNFYEYLTRVRFQNALSELTTTDKTLTEIAIDNGFPDLKTFNSRFRFILQRTPAEYRAQIAPERAAPFHNQRNYYTVFHPLVQSKFREYMRLPDEGYPP